MTDGNFSLAAGAVGFKKQISHNPDMNKTKEIFSKKLSVITKRNVFASYTLHFLGGFPVYCAAPRNRR